MPDDENSKDILISPRGTLPFLKALLSQAGSSSEGFESAIASDEDAALQEKVGAGLQEAVALFEAETERGGVMFAPDHEAASLLQSFLAESASGNIADFQKGGRLDLNPDGGFEAKFDNHDIAGWAASLFTWWKRLVKKHEFLSPPPMPTPMPDHARIAVLGDWGSGRYGAPISAATIQAATPAYDVLLHLGDVYYSGTNKEVQERFLDLWPKVPGAISRAINSNHEMYSGGEGYFGKTLPQFHQDSSCFALENTHFLFVGLDTGYEEHDLTDEQVPWLTELVEGAEKKQQKVVLLSHHQPFSALEKQGTKLVAKLGPLLTNKRIFAWYWGHEHRAVLYDRHPRWGLFGRLIGHSGFPYFRDKLDERPLISKNSDGSEWRKLVREGLPDGRILGGQNRYVKGEEHKFGPNGHLSLELAGPSIRETVHAPNGDVLFTQVIE